MLFIRSLKIYRSVTGLALKHLWSQPRLFTPFLYLAVINFAGLALIYYSPQWPVNLLLAAPIRAFYGEAALHYPYNLEYLPQIFRSWRLVTEIVCASLLTGVTISMYNQYSKKMSLRFGKNFKISFNRYAALVLFSFLIVAPPYILNRSLIYFISDRLHENSGFFLHMGRIKWLVAMGGINLLANLCLETLLLYVPVAVIVVNSGFWRSCRESLKKVFKYFLPSLLIILLPTVAIVIMEIMASAVPRLIQVFNPEISLVVVGTGIVVAFLANVLIAVSSTILFLNIHEPETEKEAAGA